MQEGVHWNTGHTYMRGKLLFTTNYPDRPGFPPFLNISQTRTMELLLAEAEKSDYISVQWSHRVVGVDHNDKRVILSVDTPDGERASEFSWLVACDGIRSAVRDLIEMESNGYRHEDRFLSMDIEAKIDLSHERHFHFDHPANPGHQAIVLPQPGDIWRVDFQLPKDADAEFEKQPERLYPRLRGTIGDVPFKIISLNTYQFNQRVVRRMRTGRVLLAGDAAHVFSPYGARGMNSGIQDAHNLAWKLARVIQGQAPEALVETYDTERWAAAHENFRVTDETIRFMAPSNRFARAARDVLLRLAPSFRTLRRNVNSGRMAEPSVYSDSPIVDEAPGSNQNRSALLGCLAPDAPISGANGQPMRLRTLLGGSFVLLYFGGDTAVFDQITEVSRHGELSVNVHRILWQATHSATEDVGEGTVAMNDTDARKTYAGQGTTWYLIRPDFHIAASGSDSSVTRLADVLNLCGGKYL
jgi:2-polyprenyl-6-methoxyphenol hydroxylase-like FAD-dependent oxidoreductase